MDAIKDLLLHKLSLRVMYMVSALASSHFVSFLVQSHVQLFLGNIFVDPTLKPGANKFLEAALSSGMLFVGEFIYHFAHSKFVLPRVSQGSTNTPSPG